jgi:plastocyanin
MTRTRHILALAALCALTLAAQAAGVTITQKGRLFSEEAVTVKKGETVTFTNDDSVPHNVVSKSPGNEFDLGYQAPGSSNPVAFDTAGDVDVICTIHPRMKLTIHVTD